MNIKSLTNIFLNNMNIQTKDAQCIDMEIDFTPTNCTLKILVEAHPIRRAYIKSKIQNDIILWGNDAVTWVKETGKEIHITFTKNNEGITITNNLDIDIRSKTREILLKHMDLKFLLPRIDDVDFVKQIVGEKYEINKDEELKFIIDNLVTPDGRER